MIDELVAGQFEVARAGHAFERIGGFVSEISWDGRASIEGATAAHHPLRLIGGPRTATSCRALCAGVAQWLMGSSLPPRRCES